MVKKIIYHTQLVTLALGYKSNFLKNILGKLFKKPMHLKTKIVDDFVTLYRAEKAYIIKLIIFLVSCVSETDSGP